MTITASALLTTSLAHNCPCCGYVVMSGGPDVLCDDCQGADCEPNGHGAYDNCQQVCTSGCGSPRYAQFYVCVTYGRDLAYGATETDYAYAYVCDEHILSHSEMGEILAPSDAYVIECEITEIPGR